MIVPQNRLLLLVGFTALPATLIAAVAPAAQFLAWGVTAALAILCVADALWVMKRCGSVKMDFPEKVNAVKDREKIVDFSVCDEKGAIGTLLIALQFPPQITSVREEVCIRLQPNGEKMPVAWPITPRERGDYLLSRCSFRVASGFGLWFGQGSQTTETHIRVYPNLQKEHKDLAALLYCRNGPGFRTQRQVGQGREFEKLRDYLPGDSMSDIHWRVTAKRGHLVTKEYQIERTQEIYVVMDASRLSCRRSGLLTGNEDGSTEPLVERYISAGLTLGALAQRQGDLFGLAVFSDRIVHFVKAGAGQAHLRTCRDVLLNLQAQPVTPNFEELAGFILNKLRRRVLLLFLTSLDDPALAESFIGSMDAVGRRHLLLVNMVRPALARPVFSGQDVEEIVDIYRSLVGHLVWHSLRELELLLKRRGIGFSLIDHEKLCVEMASQYFKVKRRQIL